MARKKLKPGHVPLWRYWDDFIDRRVKFKRSMATVKSVRDCLRLIIRHTPIVSIEDCNDTTNIENALFELQKIRGFSDSTYNTYAKNANTYFIWLKAQKIISENNVAKVERFPDIVKAQPIQTKEEMEKILLHLSTRRQQFFERVRNIFFYHILVLTGARPSELELMTISSVKKDHASWTITVPGTKNKPKPRVFRLPSCARDAYLSYELVRGKNNRVESPLFISLSKRTGWTQKGMRALLKKLSKELGFPVGLYRTRRFVIQQLAEQGIPLDKISDHFGHTRPSTTKRYLQGSPTLTDMTTSVMGNMLARVESFRPN